MRNGYCAVCADILHEGHLDFINRCNVLCDKLIVGVMTDEIIEKYKGQKPIMSTDERVNIIRHIKAVDQVILQNTFEFNRAALDIPNHTIIFDSTKHMRKNADVYLHYHEGISSTQIKERIIEAARNRTK